MQGRRWAPGARRARHPMASSGRCRWRRRVLVGSRTTGRGCRAGELIDEAAFARSPARRGPLRPPPIPTLGVRRLSEIPRTRSVTRVRPTTDLCLHSATTTCPDFRVAQTPRSTTPLPPPTLAVTLDPRTKPAGTALAPVVRRGANPPLTAGSPPTPAARAARVAQLPAEVHQLGPCVPVGYEVCSNGLDDNCNGVIEEGCGGLGGVVQFVAAWHELRADVDLEVTDPEGPLVEVGRPAPSGLKKAPDCPGVNDDCDGRNLEDVPSSEPDERHGGCRPLSTRTTTPGREGNATRQIRFGVDFATSWRGVASRRPATGAERAQLAPFLENCVRRDCAGLVLAHAEAPPLAGVWWSSPREALRGNQVADRAAFVGCPGRRTGAASNPDCCKTCVCFRCRAPKSGRAPTARSPRRGTA